MSTISYVRLRALLLYRAKFREEGAESRWHSTWRAEREISIAEHLVEPIIAARLIMLRLEDLERWTERVLCFFDRFEISCSKKRKDDRTEACNITLRHENRLVQYVGVNPVERWVALRNASPVDHAGYRNSVLLHALKNDARVEGSPFDGGEEFIRCGVQEVPAKGDSSERRIDEDSAVAVVPGQPKKSRLACFVV